MNVTSFPGAVDTPNLTPTIPFLSTAIVALEEYALAHGTKPTITGALSGVADADAKAVLTSIIAALVANELAVNGTT